MEEVRRKEGEGKQIMPGQCEELFKFACTYNE